MISTAIDSSRISRVIGYKIKNANFKNGTKNLPQRIAILGPGNTTNQAFFDDTPFEFISANEVGNKYGYGSPLYQIARILRPLSGNIIGGVSTVIYPQKEIIGATAKEIEVSVAVVSGGATENVTHNLIINGRRSIDGSNFGITINVGDDADSIALKIKDVIMNVLACPVIASNTTNVVTISTKWKGLSADDLNIEIDTNEKSAGIVYSISTTASGSGVPDIVPALNAFGETWNTIVINPYGTSVWGDLEAFNGVPDADTPTGRYNPIDFKPFVALTGTTESDKTNIVAITDAQERKSQVTNVLCPAPNSKGFSYEAAANMASTYVLIAQDSPHLGNGNKAYNDMPIPEDENIGDFADYDNRDYLAKKGSSTVLLKNGQYIVQDFETTYHPDGEIPAKFRKVRDLNIDWNIAFGWILIMDRDIHDKALVEDNSAVIVGDTISPKQAKQLVYSFITEKAELALLNDIKFSEDSVEVGINATNPARLDIFFRYKRTSTADIISSDVEVDFSFSL